MHHSSILLFRRYFLYPLIIIIIGFIVLSGENCSSGCFFSFWLLILLLGFFYFGISTLCFLYKDIRSGKDIFISKFISTKILLITTIVAYISMVLITTNIEISTTHIEIGWLIIAIINIFIVLLILGWIYIIKKEKTRIFYKPFLLSILILVIIWFLPPGWYDYVNIGMPLAVFTSLIIWLIRFHY